MLSECYELRHDWQIPKYLTMLRSLFGV